MHVHAGAVVVEDRLRHEGRGLALLPGQVLHDELVELHLVALAGEGGVAEVDLALAGGPHLVVVRLHGDPRGSQRHDRPRPEVLERVRRRAGEVALLEPGPVAEVGLQALAARVPDALLGIDVVVGLLLARVVADLVEDVELGLGPPVRRRGDAGRGEVALRLHGDPARVARVELPRDRVHDVADQRQRRHLVDRVHERGRGVGDQEHVRLLDLLEPADRRAVEADPGGERLLRELGDGHREVLEGARHVGEAQVHHLQAVGHGEGEDRTRVRLRCHAQSGLVRDCRHGASPRGASAVHLALPREAARCPAGLARDTRREDARGSRGEGP